MTELAPTIFHQPWWMDIASEGRGKEVVVSSGGLVTGRLPYVPSTRFGGLRVVGMPTLSHVLGPALASTPAAGNGSVTVRNFGLISALLAQLPEASHTSFRLHTGLTETLAFAAAGFSCDA